jgi:tight adherence protein B
MKVRTASAEVKASAIAVGSLPFIVAAATSLLSPDYISVLWTNEAGRKVVFLTLVWLCLGILVLRRMARIEV